MILPPHHLDAKNKVRTTSNLGLEMYSSAGIRIDDTDSIYAIYLESKATLETLGVI